MGFEAEGNVVRFTAQTVHVLAWQGTCIDEASDRGRETREGARHADPNATNLMVSRLFFSQPGQASLDVDPSHLFSANDHEGAARRRPDLFLPSRDIDAALLIVARAGTGLMSKGRSDDASGPLHMLGQELEHSKHHPHPSRCPLPVTGAVERPITARPRPPDSITSQAGSRFFSLTNIGLITLAVKPAQAQLNCSFAATAAGGGIAI